MKNFDEYQLLIRYKTSTQCLGIAFALMILNSFINEKIVWASPSTQTLIIIAITTIYFVVTTTLKGAYMSNKEKNPLASVGIWGFLAVVNMLNFLMVCTGVNFKFIENNMLNSGTNPLISAILLTIISLCSLYKFFKDRKFKDE